MSASPLLSQLIEALRCLPGVGQKSAQRMAYHLLERDREGGLRLAVEDSRDEPDDDQEDDHRREEGHRAGELLAIHARTGLAHLEILQLHFRHDTLNLRGILTRRLVQN